jgi:RNA polymerase sigma-70 factor (ECF subfamily)
MIDQTLLTNCAAADRKAQFELYRQSFSLAMSIAYRYVNNKEDAEAMVNAGMFKVFKSIRGFVEKGNDNTAYKAWMSRIMINTLIDDYRKNRKTKELVNSQVEHMEEVIRLDHTLLDEAIEAEHLQLMLDKLQEVQKKVFNLFVIDGYAHKEIGEMLGMAEGTSKWHLSAARKDLVQMLQEYTGTAKQKLAR